MRAADISNTIEARLALAPSIGVIAWENKDFDAAPPYLRFENVRVGSRDLTLTGGSGVNEGYAMVIVVTPMDAFATIATNLADDVAERFPYGLRLAFTGGHVLITRPPFVMQGYSDGVNWITPVRINYEAYGPSAFSNTPIPMPGDDGAPYQYLQASPSLTWTVNHNLGWMPQVTILTPGGVEIDAAVNHTGVNQFIVTFATAQAGYAIYE